MESKMNYAQNKERKTSITYFSNNAVVSKTLAAKQKNNQIIITVTHLSTSEWKNLFSLLIETSGDC